jgi:hypothetical protein
MYTMSQGIIGEVGDYYNQMLGKVHIICTQEKVVNNYFKKLKVKLFH